MKKSILFLLLFLMISGCGTSPKPANIGANTPTIPSAAIVQTATIHPTETPLPGTTQTQAAATEAWTTFFQDDFDGFLAKGWQWLNEDPANWSLQAVSGSLQINVGKGYLNLKNAVNVLLVSAPDGDFQVETSLNFPAKGRTHFTGLLLYESEENFIQAGHAYCNPVNRCVGNGIYLEEYNQGKLVQESFAAQNYDRDSVQLRLIYKAGVLTFLTSPNGLAWYRISESKPGFKILQLGLVAGQNQKEVTPVVFDYFQVKSLK